MKGKCSFVVIVVSSFGFVEFERFDFDANVTGGVFGSLDTRRLAGFHPDDIGLEYVYRGFDSVFRRGATIGKTVDARFAQRGS